MSRFLSLFLAALTFSSIQESFQSHNFDFGSSLRDFKISSRHFDDQFGEKLRKISLEKKIRISLFSEPATFKFKLVEKVIPCDDLPEYLDENNLDCRPREDHASNSTNETNSDFLKRIEIRLEFEHEFGDADREASIMIHFYPMRQAEVNREVSSALEQTNLNCLNFSEPHSFERGYFIHGSYNSSTLPDLFTCDGKFLTAINATKDRTDESLLDLSELLWLLEGIENGFLFSFPGVKCHMMTQLLTIDLDFTIVKSLQFPYLTLSHEVKTSPVPQIFSYSAKLYQDELDPESPDPDSYETTIMIVSRSMMPFLNFELMQTFTNLNASTGYEEMTFTNPNLGALAVFANWTEQKFNKSVNLYNLSDDPKAPKLFKRGVNHTNTLFHFRYENVEEDDHIFFNFGFKKDWLFGDTKDTSTGHKDEKQSTGYHLPRIEL